MRVFSSLSAAARRPGPGLPYLVMSGLLWGTGGLTGSLLSRTAGLSAIAVRAYRLTAGAVVIVAFLTLTGRRRPAGRAAWTRITVIGLLAAVYQSCYFTAVSLTSVPLATLITIGTTPVIVLGADRVAGRRISGLAYATAGLALTGLGLLVGLPSGSGHTAVLGGAGVAVLRGRGGARGGGLRRGNPDGLAAGPGTGGGARTGFGFVLGGLALMPLAAALGG